MLPFHNVAILLQFLPHVRYSCFVRGFGCPYESVVVNACSGISLGEQVLKDCSILVTHFERIIMPHLGGFPLYFHPVLIRADRKEHRFVLARLEPLEASDGVTVNGSVKVSNVRGCIHIEDRRHDALREFSLVVGSE